MRQVLTPTELTPPQLALGALGIKVDIGMLSLTRQTPRATPFIMLCRQFNQVLHA
jgi:hypothetical protein